MTENKRFVPIFDGIDKRVVGAKDNGKIISFMDMFNLLNELNWLAEGNEEQLWTVMSYLHDNYYDIWEEVNNKCFRSRL